MSEDSYGLLGTNPVFVLGSYLFRNISTPQEAYKAFMSACEGMVIHPEDFDRIMEDFEEDGWVRFEREKSGRYVYVKDDDRPPEVLDALLLESIERVWKLEDTTLRKEYPLKY